MTRVTPPPNWSRGLSPLAWLGVAVLIGGSIQFWVQTLLAAQRASLTGALGSAGLAVFCTGGMAALVLTFKASATPYAGWSDSGTTVRLHPAIARTWGTALVGGVVGSLFTVWFGSVSTVSRYLLISLLVLSVLGLLAFARSRETGYLRIGPEGITFGDILRTRVARWDEIQAITDHADTKSRNPIVFSLGDRKPLVIANADRYASSGPTLYWMVRHYWLNPGSRDELTDGQALQRLRGHDFGRG
ncbi:MAG: hypothetical protein PGN37_02850 [Mycobacterium kyogaense]|uniref:hypothetical protein n=1 Tax=Mycobacterium kyogaense TaxID=2212479 RepID=UPI002FF77F96